MKLYKTDMEIIKRLLAGDVEWLNKQIVKTGETLTFFYVRDEHGGCYAREVGIRYSTWSKQYFLPELKVLMIKQMLDEVLDE